MGMERAKGMRIAQDPMGLATEEQLSAQLVTPKLAKSTLIFSLVFNLTIFGGAYTH